MRDRVKGCAEWICRAFSRWCAPPSYLGIERARSFPSVEKNRPQSVVTELMRLLDDYRENQLEEVIENDIRVRVIGARSTASRRVRKRVEDAVPSVQAIAGGERSLCARSARVRQAIVDAPRQ